MDRIPLLDISPFVEGSETGKQEVARKIAEACETIGFFAITGHGVAAGTVEAVRRRTGETIRLWRNHQYMHGPHTEEALAACGMALCSDGPL